jgi:Uma2 family endonuclease
MSEAILDIPEVRERISRLSVAEYHRLGEYNENGRRIELIRGIVIEKISKSPLHRLICSRLFRLFMSRLPEGYTVWKEEPLTLADSEPEPDLSITRGNESDFTAAHPSTAELVIEVAVSSAALDRVNAALYAEANVPEYWIVLGQERQVEVYREPRKGQYQRMTTFGTDAALDCVALAGVRIPVADLFAP